MEYQISSIIADLDNGTLVADFSEFTQPEDYEPDGLLTRQIALVDGRPSDIAKAIRAQWRAKEQRSKWITNNPEMRSKIAGYDSVLTERWSDRHSQMVEDCAELEPSQVANKGLELLRWTHEKAPTQVEPISRGWTAHYYVQGTFQVLAIDLRVGWHANYLKLLKD
ncbi:ABC-three component system protein [Comamonas endophytica]